jgi:hypothetical protein
MNGSLRNLSSFSFISFKDFALTKSYCSTGKGNYKGKVRRRYKSLRKKMKYFKERQGVSKLSLANAMYGDLEL